MWFTLKKGSETVHVEYSHGGATLFVENVQLQPDDPFDISLDLDKNLRSRNKQENTYVDANDLASEMDTLKSVQITDATAIDGIRKALGRMEQKQSLPKRVRLRLLLNGSHWFEVAFKLESEYSILLSVVSKTEGLTCPTM